MSKLKILILGGNRFFGLHLAKGLLQKGHEISLLNRGVREDGLGGRVLRLKADRGHASELQAAIGNQHWDVVYDQICYSATEAEQACQIFKGHTKRYVVTSSESVFDYGENQSESRFNPQAYSFAKVADPKTNYQEAKRQVETVFSRSQDFEVAIVRPSLVVGLDDYTNRLKWHVERIAKGLPVYFPNLNARTDFIRSEQAGMALEIVGLSPYCGTVNCTTRGSVALGELVAMCEKVTQKRALLADCEEGESHSPYGGKTTKTMNTDLLYSMGFSAPPSSEWIYSLVEQIWRSIRS